MSNIIKPGSSFVQTVEFPQIEKKKEFKEPPKKVVEFKRDGASEGSKRAFILGGFSFDYRGGFRQDEILTRSSDEAKLMISEAKQHVALIVQEGYEDGYKRGLETGHRESMDKCIPIGEAIKKVLSETISLRDRMYKNFEREMIFLVMEVAKRVIHHEIKTQPHLVGYVLQEAIIQMREKEQLVVRIHPDDWEWVDPLILQLKREVEGIHKVEIEKDGSIDRGGCILESNMGFIDARISTQLESISEKLLAHGPEEI